MKEKVKDLDPVLRNVIDSQISRYPKMDEMDAEYYFQFVDWSKCTNEERLKYAELMYPVGTKIKSLFHFGNPIIEIETSMFEVARGTSIHVNTIHPGLMPVVFDGSNFAETVSRPDEKEETKEPEFHPGEIVDEYRNGEVYQPVIYRFFADGSHWVSTNQKGDVAFIPEEIRKIQPDPEKEIKKIAEAAVNYCDQMDEFYKGHDRDIQIAITAIRKYEALKTEVK